MKDLIECFTSLDSIFRQYRGEKIKNRELEDRNLNNHDKDLLEGIHHLWLLTQAS